jgi:hypothetical protein
LQQLPRRRCGTPASPLLLLSNSASQVVKIANPLKSMEMISRLAVLRTLQLLRLLWRRSSWTGDRCPEIPYGCCALLRRPRCDDDNDEITLMFHVA